MDTAPTVWQLAMDIVLVGVWGLWAWKFARVEAYGNELGTRFASDFPEDPINRVTFRRRQRRVKRIRQQLPELPDWYRETDRQMRGQARIGWVMALLFVALLILRSQVFPS